MGQFIDRLAARFGYRKTTPSRAQRGYAAAEVSRLTANLILGGRTTINDELRGNLDRMRDISRVMVRDNEHAKKFKRIVRNGIVGPEGFRLNSTCADSPDLQDTAACFAVEQSWWRWGKSGNCDVTGKLSLVDVCNLICYHAAIDGEYLVRLVKSAGPWGLQLQVLDPARIDTNYNIEAANGRNAIVMGVEIDAYSKPVAYHLAPVSRRSLATYVRERYPASEILHGFLAEGAEQVRGEPWMHAAIRRLNDLGGYREAAVIAARIGASKMGFFTSPEGTGDGHPAVDGTDAVTGAFVTEVAPGQFDTLPSGYDFKEFNPQYPHEQFESFTKRTLRDISAALDVDYNTLGSDLEGVNLSSLRSGKSDTRDSCMWWQGWLIDGFLDKIFDLWIDMALLNGKIVFASGKQAPASKRDKFAMHEFKGRRWGYDDPLKDTLADIEQLKHNMTDLFAVCNKRGLDFEDVLVNIQRQKALMKKYGVDDPLAVIAAADSMAVATQSKSLTRDIAAQPSD